MLEAIRLFFWTHPWWHAAGVLVPPVLIAAYFSWRELRHFAEANSLRKESRVAIAKIAELQNERNELERERNSLMEKIAENTKRPPTQAARNALRLGKYVRKTAQVSEGDGHWGGMGAEIVEISDDNVVTLFVPAGFSSSTAFAVYVHCDELQIVEEPVGSCSLQIRILKRYGNTLQLGDIRKWEDRATPSTGLLPRGETVSYSNYTKPGSAKDRRILIYAPTEGNLQYTLATIVDGKEAVVLYGDNVEISKKFAIIQVEYFAEGFKYHGGKHEGPHLLFLPTTN